MHTAALVMLLLGQVRVNVDAEAAIVVNDARYNNGGEVDVGNGYAEARVGYHAEPLDGVDLDAEVSWVPWGALDLTEPAMQNQHWLRGSGYVSRPEFLGHLDVDWTLSPRFSVGARGGAWRVAGLAPLPSVSAHYLATPASLFLTEQYDTGFSLNGGYDNGTQAIRLETGIADGDWKPGEPSVFHAVDGRSNSSPSPCACLDIRLGRLSCGVTGTTGTRGSAPGAKTRRDTGTAWASLDFGSAIIRVHGVYARRNAAGEENGRASRPVTTAGVGAELSVDLGRGWDGYAQVSWLRQLDDEGPTPDGEIWYGTCERILGFGVGVGWQPFSVVDWRLFFQLGAHEANGMPLVRRGLQPFVLLGMGVSL